MADTNIANGLTNTKGKRNMMGTAMLVVAGAVFLAIIYFTVTTVRDQYTKTVTGEPWLVETTKSAQKQLTIPGKTIPRSNDGRFGLEFSYSMWLYLDGWEDNTRYKVPGTENSLTHVLNKGDSTAVVQAPGIWLKRSDAGNDIRLIVKMNTFFTYPDCQGESCYLEKCSIGNMPVNKWVHVTISVINRYLDVYVNGFLKKRCLLNGMPKQNDGNLFLNSFGGFNGFMSRVRYFNYALPIWKIEQIISQGPSTYVGPDISSTVPPYLAYNWWEKGFKGRQTY